MDNIRGAILMVVAMFGFAVEDSLIKLMADDVPSGQILIMIGIGGTIIFAIAAKSQGQQPFGLWMLTGFSGLRAICEGLAALGYVTALALVPISLVTTIMQARSRARSHGTIWSSASPTGSRAMKSSRTGAPICC